MNNFNPAKLEQLQTLTREYSKFSRSALGLTWIVVTVSFVLCWQLSLNLNPRVSGVMMVLALGFCLFTREVLRKRLYQRFGGALEIPQTNSTERLTGFLFGIVAGTVLVAALAQAGLMKIPILEHANFQVLPILAGGVLPLIRLTNRDPSGAAMMFLLTVSVINGRYRNEIFAWQQLAQILVVFGLSTYLIWRGIQEHRRFKSLESQLSSFQVQP